MAWVAGEYEDEVRVRQQIGTSSESETSKGAHLSFNCLAIVEGGGKLGYIVARNYLFIARHFALQGKNLRGRPMIVWNIWTKFVELLYAKNGFQGLFLELIALFAQVAKKVAKPSQTLLNSRLRTLRLRRFRRVLLLNVR